MLYTKITDKARGLVIHVGFNGTAEDFVRTIKANANVYIVLNDKDRATDGFYGTTKEDGDYFIYLRDGSYIPTLVHECLHIVSSRLRTILLLSSAKAEEEYCLQLAEVVKMVHDAIKQEKNNDTKRSYGIGRINQKRSGNRPGGHRAPSRRVHSPSL